MCIETTINSVKVTFDLQTREADVAKNVGVNVGVKLSDIQSEVINLIKNHPSITHAEIAAVLSITQRTAERTTKKLRELGVLKREGSDKTGIWKLDSNIK